jgi:branched-chain amino acid transport system substrate-binding protein
MKKRLLVTVFIVLSLILLSSGAFACKGEQAGGVKEVKFGVGLPLTGLMALICGVPAEYGFEFAADKIGEFEVAGETYRWKLIILDNQWGGQGGVATSYRLIYEDGVKLMHQAGADAARSAQYICEEAGVLLDVAGAGLDVLGPDKPHIFQTSPTYVIHTSAFFDWLSINHPEVKTVAIGMTDDEIGHAVGEAVIPAAEHYGYDVVLEEYYPPEWTEYSHVATKLASKNPDLVFGSVYTLRPMKDMGWDGLTAFIGWTSGFGDYAGWDYAQGFLIYQPNPLGSAQPQMLKDFAREFRERYNASFTMCAWYGAMILYVMTEALQQAGTVDDVDRIMEVLETGTFDTMIGSLSYGGEELDGIGHMLLWPAPIAEISDHSYHVIAEYTAEEAEALAIEVYK